MAGQAILQLTKHHSVHCKYIMIIVIINELF